MTHIMYISVYIIYIHMNVFICICGEVTRGDHHERWNSNRIHMIRNCKEEGRDTSRKGQKVGSWGGGACENSTIKPFILYANKLKFKNRKSMASAAQVCFWDLYSMGVCVYSLESHHAGLWYIDLCRLYIFKVFVASRSI